MKKNRKNLVQDRLKNRFRKQFSTFSLLLVMCLGGGLTSCEKNKDESRQNTTIYDQIVERGTIRVGYIPYPPALIKDPNTKQLSGILYDVLMSAGKNLDLKIEFVEEVTWGTMIEELNSHKVDLICTAVYAKSERGKFIDFTMPVYFSPLKAFTYINNNRFDSNLSEINKPSVKIATIDGEAVALIAKSTFPRAKTVSLTQSSDVSQMLEEVSSKKADVTFVEPVFANLYMKSNPNKIKEVLGVDPIRTYPVVMMVAKDEGEFLSTINIALSELHINGFIENTINRYEPLPNSFYRLPKQFVIK